MPEGGMDRELYSLLKRFSLESLLARLETSTGDDNLEARVILEAYVETKEPGFYDLYYRSTYPLCMEWAKSYLKRANSPINPDDIVDEAFSVFLNVFLNSGLSQLQSPIGYMNRIIQKLVFSKSAELPKKQGDGDESAYNSAEHLKPIDLLVNMEENNREELQHSYIQELLAGQHEGFTVEEKEVFIDFYINKKATESIALHRDTSMYNVNKMLYRVKRKIRELTQSLISLEQREEEE